MKMFTEQELLALLESAYKDGYCDGSPELNLSLDHLNEQWEGSETKAENS